MTDQMKRHRDEMRREKVIIMQLRCRESILEIIGNIVSGRQTREYNRYSIRANKRTRTADLFITSELLYQLSYVGLIFNN